MGSLTELLRERESEIRALRQEKAELENQLMLRGNPINLDQAYAELLAHLKKREAEFRSFFSEQAEREHALERDVRKWKDRLNVSRKVIEDQEQRIVLISTEANEKLETIKQQLENSLKDNQDISRNIANLDDMVQRLSIEADQSDKEKNSDKELIDRLAGLVEKYECNQDELEKINEEMQKDVDNLQNLLEDKEAEILTLERSHAEREEDLLGDIDRVRGRLNEIIETQHSVLDKKEEEIHLLKLQICKYEDIIDEAEYVTHEQQCALTENKREIGQLSLAIERVENSGLLSQLDKIWCGSGDMGQRRSRTSLPSARDEF